MRRLSRLPQYPALRVCRRAHSWLLSLLLRNQPLAEAQLQHCTDFYLMFAHAVTTLPSPSEVGVPTHATPVQNWQTHSFCSAEMFVLSSMMLT